MDQLQVWWSTLNHRLVEACYGAVIRCLEPVTSGGVVYVFYVIMCSDGFDVVTYVAYPFVPRQEGVKRYQLFKFCAE